MPSTSASVPTYTLPTSGPQPLDPSNASASAPVHLAVKAESSHSALALRDRIGIDVSKETVAKRVESNDAVRSLVVTSGMNQDTLVSKLAKKEGTKLVNEASKLLGPVIDPETEARIRANEEKREKAVKEMAKEMAERDQRDDELAAEYRKEQADARLLVANPPPYDWTYDRMNSLLKCYRWTQDYQPVNPDPPDPEVTSLPRLIRFDQILFNTSNSHLRNISAVRCVIEHPVSKELMHVWMNKFRMASSKHDEYESAATAAQRAYEDGTTEILRLNTVCDPLPWKTEVKPVPRMPSLCLIHPAKVRRNASDQASPLIITLNPPICVFTGSRFAGAVSSRLQRDNGRHYLPGREGIRQEPHSLRRPHAECHGHDRL